MNIDINVLIQEIEKRPLIYDTGKSEYYDKKKKKMAWEEVCLALNRKWTEYSKMEKAIFGKEIKKKWHSLRDSFRRELFQQKSTVSESGTIKKPKYKHFNSLLFLTPYTNTTKNDDSSICNDDKSNDESTQSKKQKRTDVYTEIIAILKEGNEIMKNENKARSSNDNDPNKLFLLSLLPCFDNCSEEENFIMRMEIMKAILEFKQKLISPTNHSQEYL